MSKNLFDIGFVKLSKAILEWQWYTDGNASRLYIHILLKANFTEKKWQGVDIKVGEFITSLDKLHIELNLSIQSIRTALNKLRNTGYIEIKTTNRFTIIKLIQSDVFEQNFNFSNNRFNNQKTSYKQTKNNQTTTTNKEKKEKTIEERIELFKAELYKNNNYSKYLLDSFFSYWTEENKQTGRLRFEDEKYWNLNNRLLNWKDYNKTELKKSFTKNR